jgi:hypothetical protein
MRVTETTLYCLNAYTQGCALPRRSASANSTEENQRLKRLVAKQVRDLLDLKDVTGWRR